MTSVSIIIPIYNSARYLHRCFDSVIAQTLCDFECILIDDASKDDSLSICNEYVKRDKRFKVIHNPENTGSSLARKAGFEEATGTYILFVDSDDWIEANSLEKMYTKSISENLDILCCDFYVEDEGVIEYHRASFNYSNNISILKEIIMEGAFHYELWSKMIKRDILKTISFPEKSYAEDIVIAIQLFFYAKNFAYLDNAFYHYCRNSDSLTKNNTWDADKKRILDRYDNWLLIIDFLKEKYKEYIIDFEPTLSNRINNIKLPFVMYKSIRDINKLFQLYPYSNNLIFNKDLKIKFSCKIILFLAMHNILFPLKLVDILRKLLKKEKNRITE